MKSSCPFCVPLFPHRSAAGAGTLQSANERYGSDNSCTSSPSRRVQASSYSAAIKGPPIKANTTSLACVVLACVCARVRWGGWVVGGSRDNVTRLEMKHPHLQTSPSFAKSINGTDVCLLFMKNNAVIDVTKTTARWRGSNWKVTRPKSPINERIN